MKIAICYPPLKSEKGIPLLTQNRQFQWFSSPTYIYPVIPASAATLLKNNGFQVAWLDGIAQNLTFDNWLKRLKEFKPDLIFIETKTPVVKSHWKIIKILKNKLPGSIVVLAGDHVTAYPLESFKKSPVDFVIIGGHYDFLLLNICNYLLKKEGLKSGIYFRKGNKITSFGRHFQGADLNKLPFTDRILTDWHLYAYKNGNFKYTPGTYIMSGRDCWWRQNGGCTFCSWTTLFPQFSFRTVDNVLEEIGLLINKYHVREVFDDCGTFLVGKWLRDFCLGMIQRGFNKKIVFSCNMRFGVLTKNDYQLLARAGFRLLLFGLESANQKTLDKLNKGIQVSRIREELAIIKQVNLENKANLEPHLTCMVGYPWETKLDALATIDFTKNLFKKGLINSLQATIVIPYPGTRLFQQAQKNNWLLTADWDRYDMREPVMKTSMSQKELLQLTQSLYTSFLSPQFILRKILSLKSFAEFKYYLRIGRQVLGHLFDFKKV